MDLRVLPDIARVQAAEEGGEAMSEHIIDVTDGFIESYGQFSKGEIVRCRDCKWFDRIASGGVCVRNGYFSIYTTGDGFCSKAKRRDA